MSVKLTRLVLALAAAIPTLALADTGPQYVIQDLGAVSPYLYSQTFGVSDNANYAIGRSLYIDTNSTPGSAWPASIYNVSTATLQGQSGLAGHPWSWGYGINNTGVGVGFSATTTSGAGAVPVMFVNGTTTQLAMPGGQSVGHAYGINNNGLAVGSLGGGVDEVGAVYNTVTGKTLVINALTSAGSYMQTAFGISDNGLIVGAGVDSGNHNIAVVYNMNTGTMIDLPQPALGGSPSSLAFGISADGHYVVGSSGNTGQPMIWDLSGSTPSFTMAALPSISSGGSLRDVNVQGWAVGNSGGVYSNPFLVADGQSYLLSDIVTNPAGWNFTTTTSASAMGIAADGTIVGTAKLNGVEHMYMATLAAAVPEPSTYALMIGGLFAVGLRARRRAATNEA